MEEHRRHNPKNIRFIQDYPLRETLHTIISQCDRPRESQVATPLARGRMQNVDTPEANSPTNDSARSYPRIRMEGHG